MHERRERAFLEELLVAEQSFLEGVGVCVSGGIDEHVGEQGINSRVVVCRPRWIGGSAESRLCRRDEV